MRSSMDHFHTRVSSLFALVVADGVTGTFVTSGS
jgi:hypothetical protein